MKNVYLLFLICFFRESVTASVAPLFSLTREFGGSINTVLALQLEFIAITALLQIPTGRFADRFGCKTAIILGAFWATIGTGVYLFGQSIMMFYIAEALWGVGMSFMMGADSALLKSSLQEVKKGHLFQRCRSRLGVLQTSSRVLFFFIGGALWEYSVYAPFVLGLIFLVIATILSFFLKDIREEETEVRKINEMCSDYLSLSGMIGVVMYCQAIGMSLTYIAFWLGTPWMESQGISPFMIGVILALMAGITMSSNYTAGRLKLPTKIDSFIALVLFASFGLIAHSSSIFIVGIFGMAITKVVFGIFAVVFETYLLEFARKNERATILSIAAMLRNLGMGLFLFCAIVLNSYFTLSTTFIVLAILGVLPLVYVVRTYRVVNARLFNRNII